MEQDDRRGSGRTWRQLEQLPDGSVFVLPRSSLEGHIRNMLRRQGRDAGAVRCVGLEATNYGAYLRSLPHGTRIEFDHSVGEYADHNGLSHMYRAALTAVLARHPQAA